MTVMLSCVFIIGRSLHSCDGRLSRAQQGRNRQDDLPRKPAQPVSLSAARAHARTRHYLFKVITSGLIQTEFSSMR